MTVFIIGAGFTRAVFPTAPLNRELLDALSRKFEKSAAPILQQRYKTNDIEIALTKLDSDIASSQGESTESASDDRKFRGRIERELGDYFSSFCCSEDTINRSPWLFQLVDEVFRLGDTVISLNYDCVLEGALDCRGKWSPKGGYGSPFSQPLVDDNRFSKSPVTVLKIHGSASFGIAPYADKPEASAVNFVFDERFFPISAKNTHFGYGAGTGRTYLIAPSYVKVPTVEIAYLMLDALTASGEAKNLVVIGSALRPEDGFLTVLVTHFLRQPSWKSRRLLVVDPSAEAIGSRLRNFWGVDVSSQIIPITACLEDSVPLLMETIS